MEKPHSPWSAPVAVQDIPETGLHLTLEPPEAIRGELAKFAGLRDLRRVSAVFDLERRGVSIHVHGRVKALVGQNCVVTLEPIESEVDEPVDVTFAPRQPGGREGQAGETETAWYNDKAEDDAPEPLVRGTVDLGALATEFMVLGIDPYPRKPGATFTPPKPADEGAHPFAALAALKKRPAGRGS